MEKGSDNLQFEYYVLNYDINKKKVIPFNIFKNIYVQEYTERAVKKYLKNPKKFIYISYDGKNIIYGFDAFVKELDGIIKWQEWSRTEYEISVGDLHITNCEGLEKWDCYKQAHMNIEMIAYEVIRQYKQCIKKEKDGG